jgi:tetratricopeptide (TPR) repeat protein
MGTVSDYLFGKVIQCLEGKIKENPLYQKLTGNILIVSSHNSELNQLLEKSIKLAKTNDIVALLQDNEIILSIEKNIDIISECIVLPKDHLSLGNFLTRLKYNNDNEEHRKQIETFYKSLYEQIHDNKQNYPTLQCIQILSELGNIKEEMIGGFNTIGGGLQEQKLLIKTLIDYQELSYNDELNTIENKIKNREFTTAREIALGFEKKINKNNKQEEIEKLYALIINTFLLEGGRQEDALDYFDNLIAHTQNMRKKKARSILRKIIAKDFQNAQKELDIVFQTSNSEDIDSLFYENQINLYFLSGNFNAGYIFINDNKNIINNYQYFLALMLVQQNKFDDAKALLEENKEFFNSTEFEIQEIGLLIRSHALLLELRKITSTDIINALKELSGEIETLIAKAGDCKTKISYLHSVNAIILAAVYEKDAAKNEYEEALKLDPNNHNVFKNYPYLLLDNPENMDKALSLIQKYLEKYPNSLDDKILYYSILTEINPKKVINEILGKYDIEIELKIYLVYALDNINQHTDAEYYLNEMLEKYENNFSISFCAGFHYITINKPALAIEFLMRAYFLCKNETHYDLVFHYCLRTVCSEHYIDKMIIIKNWIETRYNRDMILLKYAQYYIHVLLVLDDYETCLICCNILRENGVNDDYIANAEFTSYYNTKNFQKVKQVLDENRIKYPDEILIRMVHSCASIGEYDLAKNILRKIKKPETKNEYIIIARLLFSIKEYQDSLKTIHEAYQNYPDDRNIQEIFLILVYGHHIHPQTEDVAISFGNCLQSYRTAKYDDKIIQEISIPKNANGEDILKLIAKQFPSNSDIDGRIELIRNNHLPISFYKSIFRKTIFSIQDMAINSTNIQIWCTEQFEKDLDNIRISPLYIDLSSLITLELLGLLGTVKRLFPKIYFTQSVVDEILYFDNELSEPFCDHVIITYGKKDDFTIRKPHEKSIADMKDKIGKIKSFVLSGDNVQVTGTILSPKREISKNIDDFLTNYKNVDISESDTMGLSYLADCQAMIESVALRAAFNSFQNSPMCFGIDSLLKYFLEKSLISEKKYFLSLTLLIENNYRQIPVSVKHMLFIIQYEGYIILQKHNKFFNYFASQEFDFINSRDMLAFLLSHIWNDIAPSDIKKGEWSDYLLGIIALHPLMNKNHEYEILRYVRTHIITKQNIASFVEYAKNRMIFKNLPQHNIDSILLK